MANKRDLIKDIFFNEIINEAKIGEIQVDDLIFNIGFNSCIEGNLSSGIFGDSKPILMINNCEQFINLLCEYVDECDKHSNVFSSYDLKVRIKGYLSLVWSNAIYEDFASPLAFLKKRIAFYQDNSLKIENEIYTKNIEQLQDSDILVSNLNQDIRMETPNVFKVVIKKEDNSYELPSISYGIYNGECYIYAIQNKQDSNLNEYQKKIKRSIYKMNSGIEQYNDYELENIGDVSPSTLISLSIFFDILNKSNIDKIRVISLLPVRYNSKELAFEKKYADKIASKKYSDEELKRLLLDYKLENLRIQKNLSEKLIRNFRRLESHFGNCLITSYPMEFDEYMHVTIKEYKKGENEFLNAIINNSCKISKI